MAQKEKVRGRGVAWFALLMAIVALVLSIIAYQRTSGQSSLQRQIERLSKEVGERSRKEAAEALKRLGERIEPKTEEAKPAQPPKNK